MDRQQVARPHERAGHLNEVVGLVGPGVGDASRIWRGCDDVRPREMVRARKHARGRGAIDVLDEVGIVVALGEVKKGVVVRRIPALAVVLAGRPAAAGADEDELAVLDDPDVVPRRLRDVPLMGRDVQPEQPVAAALPGRRAGDHKRRSGRGGTDQLASCSVG
jgi:hypothetical protein